MRNASLERKAEGLRQQRSRAARTYRTPRTVLELLRVLRRTLKCRRTLRALRDDVIAGRLPWVAEGALLRLAHGDPE